MQENCEDEIIRGFGIVGGGKLRTGKRWEGIDAVRLWVWSVCANDALSIGRMMAFGFFFSWVDVF